MLNLRTIEDLYAIKDLLGFPEEDKNVARPVNNVKGKPAEWTPGFTASNRNYTSGTMQLKEVLKYLDFRGEKVSFVDIGCGLGITAYLDGISLWQGYDISPERVALANKLFKKHGKTNCKAYVRDVLAADFELPQADVYYMYDPVDAAGTAQIIEKLPKHSVLVYCYGRSETMREVKGSSRLLPLGSSVWLVK